MEWAKVQSCLWETGASDTAIAAYFRLMLWKVRVEHLDGSVADVSSRGYPLDQSEIKALRSSPLCVDGALVDYPAKEVAGVIKARSSGKNGGRPRNKPPGKNPRVKTPGEKPEETREEETREEETREEETREEASTREDTSDHYGLNSQIPDKPRDPRAIWNAVLIENEWARVLKNDYRCMIGPNSWEAWASMVTEYGIDVIAAAARKVAKKSHYDVAAILEDGRIGKSDEGVI